MNRLTPARHRTGPSWSISAPAEESAEAQS
jgi:hypothetical protein